jgi:hypothetical protein
MSDYFRLAFNMGASASTQRAPEQSILYLPFASAARDPSVWTVDRSRRPLGRGNSLAEYAAAMYPRLN